MRRDQEELLSSYEEYESSRSFIGTTELIMVFLLLLLALALFFPKVYLSNEIYYTSRKINKLLDQYEILKEENRLLKQKIEEERYKNQVLGTIF